MQKHHFACGGIRFLPFSVEAEVFSSHGALSFRHPCGAGRWGEATAPCSHPGGSHSENRTACGYGIRPYGKKTIFGRFSTCQKLIFTSPSGEISHRRYITCRQRQISLAEGEFHCSTAEAVEPYASLREGGGPRSGGRSKRAQIQSRLP